MTGNTGITIVSVYIAVVTRDEAEAKWYDDILTHIIPTLGVKVRGKHTTYKL